MIQIREPEKKIDKEPENKETTTRKSGFGIYPGTFPARERKRETRSKEEKKKRKITTKKRNERNGKPRAKGIIGLSADEYTQSIVRTRNGWKRDSM